MWRFLLLLFILPSLADAAPPVAAKPLLPVMSEVVTRQWPAMPLRHLPCGQVEQESGWDPKAHLHTSREDGYGLVQMTVTPRFNIFKDAVKWKALRGWQWQNDKYNVRNQLIFLILQDRSNFSQWRPFAVNDEECWKMALVSYNAGAGRVLARRRQAKLDGRIPANRWTGGLEKAHGPKEDARLYGRPLWQAVNEYPVNIFSRALKYMGAI